MASLEELFNHLVLPSKVPGQQDQELAVLEDAILHRLADSCATFLGSDNSQLTRVWAPVAKCLDTARHLNQDGLDQDSLLDKLTNIDADDYLILYVAKQNSGLVIRCDVE
jgi:hypothetical protein